MEKKYQELTLEELITEEKKIKKRETISRFLIGFLIGVLIFGIVKKGIGFLHIFLPLVIMAGIYKDSQRTKEQMRQVQTEIAKKQKKE
ncbi:MAG: hypothetical protein AAGJ93_05735 [Bacteroidota bacterium]